MGYGNEFEVGQKPGFFSHFQIGCFSPLSWKGSDLHVKCSMTFKTDSAHLTVTVSSSKRLCGFIILQGLLQSNLSSKRKHCGIK